MTKPKAMFWHAFAATWGVFAALASIYQAVKIYGLASGAVAKLAASMGWW